MAVAEVEASGVPLSVAYFVQAEPWTGETPPVDNQYDRRQSHGSRVGLTMSVAKEESHR